MYKAEDLLYDHYANDWDLEQSNDDWRYSSPPKRRRLGDSQSARPEARRSKTKHNIHYVALKKIYVTSSPMRIQNELELLNDLRGCVSVCPLITAFRHQDQVVAVLPYFPHTDFRIQYRTFLVADMRHYFRSLLTALHAVHKQNIIHRDIKPTSVRPDSSDFKCDPLILLSSNFLYNPERRQGVLVDFGLAEVSLRLFAYRLSIFLLFIAASYYRDSMGV